MMVVLRDVMVVLRDVMVVLRVNIVCCIVLVFVVYIGCAGTSWIL